MAAHTGDSDIINLLLTWGAQEDVVDDENLRPVDCIPAHRSDVKTLFDPINVRKVKKDRRDPWKSLEDITFPEICNEFDLIMTACRRSTAGSADIESTRVAVGPTLYHPAGTEMSEIEVLEQSYILDFKIREKKYYKTEDFWKWIHIPSNNVSINYPGLCSRTDANAPENR